MKPLVAHNELDYFTSFSLFLSLFPSLSSSSLISLSVCACLSFFLPHPPSLSFSWGRLYIIEACQLNRRETWTKIKNHWSENSVFCAQSLSLSLCLFFFLSLSLSLSLSLYLSLSFFFLSPPVSLFFLTLSFSVSLFPVWSMFWLSHKRPSNRPRDPTPGSGKRLETARHKI